MKKILLFILTFLLITKVNALELTKNAGSAILIESTTGKILYSKDEHEKRSPASMTKMMTLLLAMEALEDGRISLTDKVYVSKNASSMGGTQIFIEENTEIELEKLMKGIAIASANDAAVALAEHIAGSEENFVNKMNEKAKSLGCKNTNFKNPHGLDEKDHYTTAYDMSLIAKELVMYPYAIELTSTYEDYIKIKEENHWLVNTNKLIRFYKGMDGLKTGYTDNAGYCLTATMNKNNMRLISVVMKEDTKEHRNEDTISMMEYGYSSYGSKTIIEEKDFVETMYINNAENREVNYYLEKDVNLIVSKDTRNIDYKINKELFEIKAPISKNTKVGKLTIEYDNNEYEYNLIVKEDIKKSTFIKVLTNTIKDLMSGIKL